jgi:excisionase family DNA binding protein
VSASRAATDVKLLTVVEAAGELHVHPNTVRRLLDGGRLTKVKLGRSVRVSSTELEAYVRGGGDLGVPAPVAPDQIKALHGKAAAIDRATERPPGTAKKAIFRAASTKFERPIESTLDLAWLEADWVLDRLQESCVQLGIAKRDR